MLTTPFSRLHISCSCTECNNFLRPFPSKPPPMHLLDALPSSLGHIFSLPPTPAATPIPTYQCTPHAIPQLQPTAPTLAPSPAFLLAKSSPQKSRNDSAGGPLALPSLFLSTSQQVNLASRALWAHISSPIDEMKTPLSAKTPGLAKCTQAACAGKVVPGFSRSVCKRCVDELRGAVLGLAAVMSDGVIPSVTMRRRPEVSRNDSLMVSSPEHACWSNHPEPELFAVPSTPPSVKLLRIHSSAHSRQGTPQQDNETAEPILFALPNTSLDKSFEEYTPTTPTTKYVRDFPALPVNCKVEDSNAERGHAASGKGSKTSSSDVERLARLLSRNDKKEAVL